MTAAAVAAVYEPVTAAQTAVVVPTPRGFVPLSQLNTGDPVFGSDGNPTIVAAVTASDLRSTIRIGFSDGASTLAAHEQLWRAFDTATTVEGYYRSADIAANLAMPDGTARWSTPLAAAVDYPEAGPTAVDPRTFGEELRSGIVETETELLPYLLGSINVRREVLTGLLGVKNTLPGSAPALAAAACASLVRSLGGTPALETAGFGHRIIAHFGVRRHITAAEPVSDTFPGGLTVTADDGMYLTGGDYVLTCGSWGQS